MRVSKKAILAELEKTYPDARPELNFRNPYETLVAVMLSAQCTDKQVNKVTPALFERYPDVESMAAASVEDVYPMVKSCGFKSKATNIVESCRMICQRFGGQVPGDMEALQSLPGVGRKTANVVLANAFGVPTHRGGYPCVPGQQPAGTGGCEHGGKNGGTADEGHSQTGLGGRPSLADLPWPQSVPRQEPGV